jgi:putative endonuclease
MSLPMPFYLYILQSETTGRYYVGQTEHLEERVAYHQANYSKALKNRGPWTLCYSERYQTRSEAVLRERYIKRQKDRKFIEALVSASR